MLKKRWVALAGMTVAATSFVAWAATSYQVQTKLSNAGGTMKVREKATQTTVGSIGYNNFTTSALVPVTVTANPGYSIYSITQTGQPTVYNPASPWSGNFLKSRGTVQAMVATFAISKYSVTTSTTGNGTISPKPVPAVSYNGNVTVYATPTTLNSYVKNVAVGGGGGATSSQTLPDATGKVAITLTGVKANATVAVDFDSVTASAGANKIVAVNTPTTIPGTATGGDILWTASGGTLTNATSATPTFSADVPGTYTLTMTNSVDGRVLATDSMTVTVVADMFGAMRTQCNGCHNPSSTAAPSMAFAGWSSSAHKANSINCITCHTDAPMPTPINTATVDATTFKIKAASAGTVGAVYCANCHKAGGTAPDYLPGHATAEDTCTACHVDAHNPAVHDVSDATCGTCHAPAPHYGGTAFLKAQYISAASLPISCANCHVNTTANQAILAQFAQSAHGNAAGEAWIHYDWRTANRSSCARCHTATGFVAKLGNENDSSNVFQPTDVLKPGEALACSACHTDAGTGEVRAAAQQFTINMRNGATATYDVAGASGLCARCHSGRETGDSIMLDSDVTGLRPFVDSHYQPVAGTLYNQGGYEYAGQIYDSLGSHKDLGATSQGPCVTCHMSGKNHTFVAVSCGACHDGTTAPVVDAATLKANYDGALNDLKLALEAKGIYYGPVHPFFFTAPYVAGSANLPYTNWAAAYGATAWKDTMGAAFNYNMLWSEKGAFAHNYNYAMKLIADSIDFLNDGTVGGP